MRKLLQVVICGLAAASFSALAADNATTEKSTGTNANAAGNAGVGASADVKTDKAPKRKVKKEGKHDRSAAGGTRAEPATAPAPAPVDTEKK